MDILSAVAAEAVAARIGHAEPICAEVSKKSLNGASPRLLRRNIAIDRRAGGA